MITDFIFLVEDKEYKCYASSISAFSPFIRELIRQNQFSYKFQNFKDPNEDFKQLIKLINGFEIDLTISNVTLLNEVSKVLQIQSLFEATDTFIKSIQHSPDNILSLLESYVSHQISCPEVVQEVVNKWDTFETLTDSPKEGLLLLSVESFEHIFSSPNFSIKNQDTFFELIIKIIEQNGQPYSSLFSYCDFTKLTSNQIFKMIEIAAFDSIPPKMVCSLEQKFIKGADTTIRAIPDSPEQRFLSKDQLIAKFKPNYDDLPNFNGIFHHILTYSTAVFDKYVEVSCGGKKSSYLNTLFEYSNIEALHWDNYSDSNPKLDFKNAWIMISLPHHKIKLDDYTLIVYQAIVKTRPKSWTISARNHTDPPDYWKVIEEKSLKKSQNIFQNKDKYIKTFSIANDRNFYSQFKIQFTESQGCKKTGTEQEIVLCGIEFYGTMIRI